MKKICLLLISTALIGWADRALSQTVDIELAFLIDTSSSILPSEFTTQRQAYVNLFNNDFYNRYVAPLNGRTLNGQVGTGRIAVNVFTFGSSSPTTAVINNIGWTQIASQANATAFANQIATISYIGGRTPIGLALQQTADSIFGNSFTAIQTVIDLSSDGQNTPTTTVPANPSPQTASNYARCAGNLANTACVNDTSQTIVAPGGVNVINAIGILPFQSLSTLELITYGTNLSGTTNIFEATDINVYETTLSNKLVAETGAPSQVPEPGLAFGLIGLGMFGVGKKCLSRRG